MHFLKDQGIVIRRRNVGEADKMVTFFSQHHGKLTVVAKGVRKITSRRGGLLEPFNLLQFQAVKSHSRYILTEVKLVSSCTFQSDELHEYQKLFSACEIVDALCGEEEPSSVLYDHIVRFASNMTAPILEFQTNMLVSLGYWNPQRQFASENDSYRYIESIIERKLRSRRLTR